MTFSEPIKHKPLLIVEPDFEWEQSITINSDLNYFYVPSLPEWARFEYDGLLYEGTQYSWDEVDFRLSADLTVPGPSTYALLVGFIALVLAFTLKRKK